MNWNQLLSDKRFGMEEYHDRKHAMAFCNRGLAKIKLNDKNGGCLDLSKAGELGFQAAYESIKKYCN